MGTATVRSLFNAGSKLAAITLSPMSHEELINAAQDGNSVECARLLEANADPNLQDDEYGDTALIYAAYEGHPEVSAELLQAKANPDLKNEYGDTALVLAKNQGNSEVCDLLEKALAQALEQDVNRVRSEWV